MKKTLVFLFLLFHCVALLAQTSSDKDFSKEIDAQVWEVFKQAYASYDAEQYIGLHTADVLRVTKWGIKEGSTFRESIQQSFSRADQPRKAIDFQFEHRIHSEDLAYEVGYYKSTRFDKEGNSKSSYGRFHVVLKKTEGRWKIAQDWDTGNVNGTEVRAADFDRLASKGKAQPALSSEQLDERYLPKVQTLDSLLANLYGVISGEAGEERDWELFRYLFKPEARLIPSGKNQEGKIASRYLSPDDYIRSSGEWLVKNGFFEKEIHRKTESFGNITQVFSTYEAFKSESDEAPFLRGINSIQLLNDGQRWWVINIYWTNETADSPLPDKYLKE